MSWKASAYVKDLLTMPNGKQVERTEKLVLLVLADYHNTDSNTAWPSRETLAAKCLLSERHLQRIIGRLERSGVLIVKRDPGMQNVYSFPSLDENVRGDRMSGETGQHIGETQLCLRGGDVTASHKPPMNPNTITSTILFDRFWASWPKKVAKNDAIKAWKKLKVDDQLADTIIKAVELQKRHWSDYRYIPNPASWLNSHRWEDEIGPKVKSLADRIKELEQHGSQ